MFPTYNYRLPIVTDIFSSASFRFRLTDYDPSVSLSDISVFVSVQLKNVKVKMGEVFFLTVSVRFHPYQLCIGSAKNEQWMDHTDTKR
jgi:hypothetical protein